ncbi:MAG TPA: sigma-70 family RNA polymerase sigma factor [Candidatus Didemnitutus sp.]|nr:sigma-70 family RNA polymerase sigma factor [Candidatus Didemnitutus sp.]
MDSPSALADTFRQWLAEHRGIIIRIARSFTNSPADLADLQQEMQVQLWHSVARFSDKAKPSTWIYRVCLNTALTWRRASRRREISLEPALDVASLAAENATPAEQSSDRDAIERLYAAIHQLPHGERSLVLLALEGLPYREIAEITGLTENHVGVALTRARRRLATLMKGAIDELE